MVPLLHLAGTPPANLGVRHSRLTPCSRSWNCVGSDEPDGLHAVKPLELLRDPHDTWEVVLQIVKGSPRTRVVVETEAYIHVECSSRVLGFVDDFELHLRPEEKQIAVRSASRLGWYDMGVNRRRIEAFRSFLRGHELVP